MRRSRPGLCASACHSRRRLLPSSDTRPDISSRRWHLCSLGRGSWARGLPLGGPEGGPRQKGRAARHLDSGGRSPSSLTVASRRAGATRRLAPGTRSGRARSRQPAAAPASAKRRARREPGQPRPAPAPAAGARRSSARSGLGSPRARPRPTPQPGPLASRLHSPPPRPAAPPRRRPRPAHPRRPRSAPCSPRRARPRPLPARRGTPRCRHRRTQWRATTGSNEAAAPPLGTPPPPGPSTETRMGARKASRRPGARGRRPRRAPQAGGSSTREGPD
mmetsp:Transcript_100578/g.280124  ORF Transcript_100578/g.280124 Transcript_100578/m.280124 type:complete len:276 (-) Transcript_100578:108-935(-)